MASFEIMFPQIHSPVLQTRWQNAPEKTLVLPWSGFGHVSLWLQVKWSQTSAQKKFCNSNPINYWFMHDVMLVLMMNSIWWIIIEYDASGIMRELYSKNKDHVRNYFYMSLPKSTVNGYKPHNFYHMPQKILYHIKMDITA